jgi:flavin-dependent dehydrogenase
VKQCQTLIVGAGPAGSFLAYLLARSGQQVMVLDRARFPRAKVCGDSLNPRCAELWRRQGLWDSFSRLPHAPIVGVSLENEHGPLFVQDQPGREHRAVERRLLDAWLVQQARQAGAEVWEETTLQQIGDHGEVVTSAGEVRADRIVGADGRNSQIARLAGLIVETERCPRVGWQTHVPASWVPDQRVHLRIFSEGYYGLVRINETQADLCLVLDAGTEVTADTIVQRYLPGGETLQWKKLSPIERKPVPPGRGALWLVGDAARVVEPFTGEGIYFALATAELAAQAILTKTEAQALPFYNEGHRQLYHRYGAVNRTMQWLLRRPIRAQRALSWARRVPGLVPAVVRLVQG